ncbi:hypothetical protein [Nocardioides plantarum]|uniref:Uncharacterized protein n=1 Tax=Nocardioides plantarum TaxID=29299 RepID=A0ABV5KDX3_9ACTN|nr:hypothetical protein [Nocardioides plantarum]
MSVALRLTAFVAGLVVIVAVAMGVGRATGPVGPIGPAPTDSPSHAPTAEVGTDGGH